MGGDIQTQEVLGHCDDGRETRASVMWMIRMVCINRGGDETLAIGKVDYQQPPIT
jgi:hypothetical protein